MSVRNVYPNIFANGIIEICASSSSFHQTSEYFFVPVLCFHPVSVTGEACWWTVHPASKQRSEGEKVRVGDDVIFVSVATERYLVSSEFNLIQQSMEIKLISASNKGKQSGHRQCFIPRDPVECVALRHRSESPQKPAVCVWRRRAEVSSIHQTAIWISFVRNCI